MLIISSHLKNCLENSHKILYFQKVSTLALGLMLHSNKWLCQPFTPSSPSNETMVVLKNLGSNKDLVIIRPGKGNGVAFLDQQDYLMKMQAVLDDWLYEAHQFEGRLEKHCIQVPGQSFKVRGQTFQIRHNSGGREGKPQKFWIQAWNKLWFTESS